MDNLTPSTNGAISHASTPPAPKARTAAGGLVLEPLTVGAKDLARVLGISPATLFRWDAAGFLGPGFMNSRYPGCF